MTAECDEPSEDRVELLTACRDADNFLALVPQFHCGHEARGGWLAFMGSLEIANPQQKGVKVPGISESLL